MSGVTTQVRCQVGRSGVAEVDDVAGDHRVDLAGVVANDERAIVGHLDGRPLERTVRSLDAHPPPERHEPRAVGRGDDVRRVEVFVEPSEERVEQRVAIDRTTGFEVARRRGRPRAPAGRRSQFTLQPAPTTTVSPSISARMPASFRSRTTRSLGHLSPTSIPATSTNRLGERDGHRHHGPVRARGIASCRRRQHAPTRAATTPAAPPIDGRADRGRRSDGRRPRRAPARHRRVPGRAPRGSSSRPWRGARRASADLRRAAARRDAGVAGHGRRIRRPQPL